MQTWYNLRQFLFNVIGSYTPLNNENNLSSIDFPYIMACILFIIIVHSFFKFIFYLIYGKSR